MSLWVYVHQNYYDYCKRGYFCWDEFRGNVGKTFHLGVFSRNYSYFLHKFIWVLFSRGGNIREEDKSAKNMKITPTQKFPRLQYLEVFISCLIFLLQLQKPLMPLLSRFEVGKFVMRVNTHSSGEDKMDVNITLHSMSVDDVRPNSSVATKR